MGRDFFPVLRSSGPRVVHSVSGPRSCTERSPTSQPFRFRASLQTVPAIRSAQAGAEAPGGGGGTRQYGPAPLPSSACKYLLPLGESHYSACARLAKSLSKHAQMTALGIPRHAVYLCPGLVTMVLQPRRFGFASHSLEGNTYRPLPLSRPRGARLSSLGVRLGWVTLAEWISTF